jgi:hypothetical protein
MAPLLQQLDKGVELDINGQRTMVCAFTHVFLGE